MTLEVLERPLRYFEVRFRMRIGLLILTNIVLSSWFVRNESQAFTLKVSSKETIAAPRQLFDPQAAKGASLLVKIKLALKEENFRQCVTLAEAAYVKEPQIKEWLATQALECAVNDGQGGVEYLKRAVARVEAHPGWLQWGPQMPLLKPLYVRGLLLLAERSVRDQRSFAQKTLKRLLEIRTWLNRDQVADTYKTLGELAFLVQDWHNVEEFFLRSLEARESDELRARLESLPRSGGSRKEPGEKKRAAPAATSLAVIEATDEEEGLYRRQQTALAQGDLAAAVEDGVELLQKFPGGRRARWSQDRILECYMTAAQKAGPDGSPLQQKIVRGMLKVDGGRLLDWGASLFQKGFYSDAKELADRSYELMRGQPDASKALRLAARASLLSGDLSAALKKFEVLIREHAGTAEAVEAAFRKGLVHFRKKQWSEALAALERVQVLPGADDYQYSALYWFWRVQQQAQPEKASATAQQIVSRYPLSYYGIRARAELKDPALQLPEISKLPVLKSQIVMTELEQASFGRFQRLLEGNWFREAQEELKTLPRGHTTLQKVLFARYALAAMDDAYVFQLFGQAIDDDPSYLRLDVLSWIYPREFQNFVKQETGKTTVSEALVFAVMRQESTFKVDAISSSQAQGLMQLLVPTAREIAGDLRLKANFDSGKPLFEPAVNIRLGTNYLSRLLRSFKGHVPLAVAAYNVGPGRMKRFLQSRPEIVDLEKPLSSDPEDELWIDEMPWSETSYYVKAVLRNYLIYQWLETGELKLPSPVWSVQRGVGRAPDVGP